MFSREVQLRLNLARAVCNLFLILITSSVGGGHSPPFIFRFFLDNFISK